MIVDSWVIFWGALGVSTVLLAILMMQFKLNSLVKQIKKMQELIQEGNEYRHAVAIQEIRKSFPVEKSLSKK